MASILGTLAVFLPLQTLFGLITFAAAYYFLHNFDLSAAIGLGLLALLTWRSEEPDLLLWYTIVLFLSIPAKKALDWPRRRRLRFSG